ncbi:hypothetical protein A4U61_29670 [Streptomyces sp. H-KF8]|nr:hypothetical protein A4U61_29670 [Streptomyces sp. H-KF8]
MIVGLVVRDGVMASPAGRRVTGSGRPGHHHGRRALRPALSDRTDFPDRTDGPGLFSLVRLGGRQGEHRTGRGLLRRRPLGGRRQRTPAPPGRLILLSLTLLLRLARLSRTLLLALSLRGTGRSVPAAHRGQRGRQGVLLTGHLPGELSSRRNGYTLRRYGPAQPGVRGGGPRRGLGGRDDGPLGHTASGAGRTDRTGDRAQAGRGGGLRALGRPAAPPSGPAGDRSRVLAGCRSRSRRLRGLRGGRGRPAPAPTGGHGGLRTGAGTLVRPRHLTLQEGVHRGPPGPAPSAAGTLLTAPASGGLLHRDHFRNRRPARRYPGGQRQLRGRLACGDGTRAGSDGHLEDERAAAHPRHLVRLQHTSVRPYDPAHDRLVHRIAAAVRPAHLDPHDLAALCRRDHDRVVQVAARRHGTAAGGVDARDVRDEVRESGGEQP